MTDKKLCVVIPYRDRESHLHSLLPRLKESLDFKNITYQILVVEQEHGKKFNRGYTKNIGAKWAIDHNFDYVCFHDVDMIPVLEHVNYSYEEAATHLATNVQQFGYKLPYNNFYGGVLLITTEALLKMNGYCNDFWTWGAEDDDFFNRCNYKGIVTSRKTGRFDSFNHERDIIQEDYNRNVSLLGELTANPSRYIESGINTLNHTVIEDTDMTFSDVNYKILKVSI